MKFPKMTMDNTEWLWGYPCLVIFTMLMIGMMFAWHAAYVYLHGFFMVVWFCFPLLGLYARMGKLDTSLTHEGMESLRTWGMVLVIALSITIYADRRVEYSYARILGGHVHFHNTHEEDDEGNEITERTVQADNGFSAAMIEWYRFWMLIPCAGFPWAFFKGFQHSLRKHEEKMRIEKPDEYDRMMAARRRAIRDHDPSY